MIDDRAVPQGDRRAGGGEHGANAPAPSEELCVAAVGCRKLEGRAFTHEDLVIGLKLPGARVGAHGARAGLDEDDVIGIDGSCLGLGQGPIWGLSGAVSERGSGVVDVDDVPGLTRHRVDRSGRGLVGADDVLVSHHRLLHLVGHVAAAAPAHAVGEPGKPR